MTDTRPSLFSLSLLGFFFRRILPTWVLCAAMIFLIQIAVAAIVHDNQSIKAFLSFLDMLPSIVKAAIGGESLQLGNIAALLAIGYQHPLVLLLLLYFTVAVPTGLLPGEVESGTMELILSRSITKTQVYVCAGLLTIAGMFFLILIMFSGTVAGTWIFQFDEPVPLDKFFRLAVNAGVVASTAGAIALLAAAVFRTRNVAVGVTVSIMVLNYFIKVVAAWWPPVEFLKPLTLFHYVGGEIIFREGRWPLGDMGVLAAVIAVSAIAGALIWHRRDLPM